MGDDSLDLHSQPRVALKPELVDPRVKSRRAVTAHARRMNSNVLSRWLMADGRWLINND